ncbi:uncharacterized protein RSE6_04000 [Rhynchosporium secalis]|uniref:Uncharacterized protein n=1 Tax=Rhynchosporium secalis TaxID=38038 RepID=A0A1E1M474_RHYSE|nr:uncharacterized protein RSE6_04000 [Rhynchosporium secalis]
MHYSTLINTFAVFGSLVSALPAPKLDTVNAVTKRGLDLDSRSAPNLEDDSVARREEAEVDSVSERAVDLDSETLQGSEEDAVSESSE